MSWRCAWVSWTKGGSAPTVAAAKLDGIELSRLDDEAELWRLVEANDLDAGLVLPPGCDGDLRAGLRPKLRFCIGGESLASNRVIFSVMTVDLVRTVERRTVSAEVVEDFGEGPLPRSARFVPLIVCPVIFYLFPDWPQWIARVFLAHWFIDPLYRCTRLCCGATGWPTSGGSCSSPWL